MQNRTSTIISDPSPIREQWLSPERAIKMVRAFEREFGAKHLLLACHAALPMFLTPELLNLINNNFLAKDNIPWIAEADLFLSPLCRQIGDDLFEVEPGVREVLLVKLEKLTDWERPFKLAAFLQFYLDKKTDRKLPPYVTTTQLWIAKAYIDPDSVIRQMTDLLEKSLSSEQVFALDLPGQIQVATTLELITDPLERANSGDGYRYLLNNSRILTHILYGEGLKIKRDLLESEGEREEVKLLSPVIQKWVESLGESSPVVTGGASLTDETPTRVTEKEGPSENAMIFRPGGAMRGDSELYIERATDTEVMQHLLKGDYVWLIAPRGQGKTSLITHLVHNFPQQDTTFAIADLSMFSDFSTGSWYQGLSSRILDQLNRFISPNQRPQPAQDARSWYIFVKQVASLALEAHRRVVIILDEIDVIASSENAPYMTEFFVTLRSIFNARSVETEFEQVAFLLASTFIDPAGAIADEKFSPFNIAYRVSLSDFTAEQVRELVKKGKWPPDQANKIAERIHYWTDGQPYLTQLLCSYLSSDDTDVEVDKGVERLFIEDTLLGWLAKRLSEDKNLRDYLVQIQAGEQIFFGPYFNSLQAQLESVGAIKPDEQGNCRIRNRIYERAVLDLVKQEIPKSDPFSELTKALQSGTLLLFLGSDLSSKMTGLPSFNDLVRNLARRQGIVQAISPVEAIDRVEQLIGRRGLIAAINEAFSLRDKSPTRFYEYIVRLLHQHQLGTIVTTAFDDLLEQAFQAERVPFRQFVPSSNLSFVPTDTPALIKLYGDLDHPDMLILTESDLAQLINNRDKDALLELVRQVFRLNTTLFLGYNFADPNATLLLNFIGENRPTRTGYAVWSGLSEAEISTWRDRGIEIIDMDPLAVVERLLSIRSTPVERSSTLEQTVRLPPLEELPRIDVQIRIFSRGDEYTADILYDGPQALRFRIELTPGDVEEVRSRLVNAFLRVSEPVSFNTGYQELARSGAIAFRRVFSHGEFISKILEADVANLQISSEDFVLPWELLYDGPIDSMIDASGFWGMRYIISRNIITTGRPFDLETIPTTTPSRPAVGIVAYNQLSYTSQQEIPMIEGPEQRGLVEPSFFRSLQSASRTTALENFGQFLRQNLQVLQISGQVHMNEKTGQSYLNISDNLSLSIEEFNIREWELKSHPLIILNVSMPNSMQAFRWAEMFWRMGARGVLTTEFPVQDQFAASFIQKLYEYLLVGHTVGEALLSTRRYFWYTYSDLHGLAYALYSSPSIRIQ